MTQANKAPPCGGKPALNRPWDARLAEAMVRPLLGTRIRPNHLTMLRLFVGLAGVVLIVRGTYLTTNLGMGLVVVASFLDHTDGALARLGGYASRFGHLLDLAVDALITVLLFVALGVVASSGGLGNLAIGLGLVAGVAVSAMFYMRMRIEEQEGKAGTRQPHWGGFELEDVLYVLPLVSLLGVIEAFVVVAAIGTSGFSLWVLRDYLRVFGPAARRDINRHTADAGPQQ